MENAIVFDHVSKAYSGYEMQDVSFTLPTGCILGLIGENGAGKSTAIRMLLGLARPDHGSIHVLGQDAQDLPAALRQQIGVVLDECCFPEILTLQSIRKILPGLYPNCQAEVFDRYAARFDLPSTKPIKTYSRGMTMKLSIAAALSHNARLLVLDEATSGLDPIVRDELLDVFLEFIQDEGHSILLSSHILSDLEKACDYIAYLHQGRLIFCQPKDELLDRYGVLKCTDETLAALDPAAVVGVRRHRFGADALVERTAVPEGFQLERASIEDLMLYFGKEH